MFVLVSATVLSGMILASSAVSADDVIDDVAVTVPISCTMSGSGMTSHTANLRNGTYTPNIGTTTMNVFCNDTSGFSIYAIGFSGDSYVDATHTKLIGTNASNKAAIDTGTATSAGNPDVSNWAMKLATDSEATYPLSLQNDFGSYHTIPSEYTKVATRTAGTDIGQNATGSTLTSTYAAYISRTQAADSYTGKVKYILLHPNDGPLPIIPSCPNPVPNLTYMQDLNSSNKSAVLASMTEDDQYYLKDKRDEKYYCVAKLKDGNIWMTQNLDHDIVTDGSVIYDNTTTDLGWNPSTNSYDAATWSPSNDTYATGTNLWNGFYVYPESYDPGELYINEEAIVGWGYYSSCDAGNCDASIYDDLSNDWKAYFDSCDTGTLNNCDDSLLPTNNTSQNSSIMQYKIGNYYNWTAAVAKNDTSNNYTQYEDIDQSICPSGWTLPKAGDNASAGSFQYLATQYGWDAYSQTLDGYTSYKSPLYLNPAGRWYGSPYSIVRDGYWWSSVVSSSNSAYDYDMNVSGDIKPSYPSSRNLGFNIRCVNR